MTQQGLADAASSQSENHLTRNLYFHPCHLPLTSPSLLSVRFEQLLDRHTSSLMTFRMSNSWFVLRADELGVLMLAVIGAVLLLVPGASPAEAGLILSLVYDTILVTPFRVMRCSELAALLSAVDRCTEYCQVRVDSGYCQ